MTLPRGARRPLAARAARSNRRADRRRSLRRQLLYRHVDQPVFSVDTTADVSEGGLFIATMRPLVVGSPIVGYLRPDGSGRYPPIRFRAVVAWRSPRLDLSPKGPGIGVRFTQLDAEARGCLEALLGSLPAMRAPRI